MSNDSTSIERYQPATSAPASASGANGAATAMERAADFASWAPKLQAAAAIAREICQTDFVPTALRGSPSAVTAAILAGSEMNIGPMASLMHVHMIDGRPSLSAEMQRALVLALGHRIRYREMTNTRCVVDGQRAGEAEWTTVVYTLDDAKNAGLAGKQNWRRYPRRMLAARATAELCRLVFSDALSGMPYTADELEDDTDDVGAATGSGTGGSGGGSGPESAKPKRRAQRRTPARTASTGNAEAAPAPGPEPVAAPAPPLPGEDGYAESSDAGPEPVGEAEDAGVTQAQLKRIHAGLTTCGVTERDERLSVASTVVGRQLSSSTELTRTEATTLIDTLAMCETAGDDPPHTLRHLLEAARGAEAADGDTEVQADTANEADGAEADGTQTITETRHA